MGWSGGSSFLEDVVDILESNFDPEEFKVELVDSLVKFIKLAEDMDADTLNECIGYSDVLDLALYEVYPEWFE